LDLRNEKGDDIFTLAEKHNLLGDINLACLGNQNQTIGKV
jgi:hypothetical protein